MKHCLFNPLLPSSSASDSEDGEIVSMTNTTPKLEEIQLSKLAKSIQEHVIATCVDVHQVSVKLYDRDDGMFDDVCDVAYAPADVHRKAMWAASSSTEPVTAMDPLHISQPMLDLISSELMETMDIVFKVVEVLPSSSVNTIGTTSDTVLTKDSLRYCAVVTAPLRNTVSYVVEARFKLNSSRYTSDITNKL